MSFFDHPYYALTKSHMCRSGIWPEQSKYVRIILPLTIFVIILTLAGPAVAVVISLIRLLVAWPDIDILRYTTMSLIGIGIFFLMLSCMQHADIMNLSLKKIEEHWEMCKNTPAEIVLHEYAERGRYITVVYSTCIYGTMALYFGLCLSPVIIDFIDPENETRPKIYIVELEYGVDADKYYWIIIAHTYIVSTIAIGMMVAISTMYILLVVHACALFEVVGFKLELIANKYTVTNENTITVRIDWDYKKVCDCIIVHAEAISFADLIEHGCWVPCGVVLAIIATIMVISGVQTLMYWKRPEVLMQQAALIIGQVFHLYMISVPGQEIINRSGKIHTIAYNLDWHNMSASAQKLLIPMLVRSNRPCYFTAGKVYVLSMETFSSAIRMVMSYFTIFAQMV